MAKISLDEWLAKIGQLRLAVDGFTTTDLMVKAGKSRPWAVHMMNTLVRNGTCEYVGKKQATAITGMVCWVPVYRFKDTDDEPKKKKIRRRRI